MKIASIIVTYNGIKWVEKSILSIIDISDYPQLIIIDNYSSDGTDILIKERFPGIHFVQNKQNLGFGQANNIGIRKAYDAGADYFFLLNQDAWVEPDTLSTLIDTAEKYPEYGIISPLHLNGAGDKLDYLFSNYITPKFCPNLCSDLILKDSAEINPIYEVDFINAAAWLITRETIEKVGGFNPLFFHYGEDRDYVNRVKFHGFKVGICPKTKIFHDREYRDDSSKNNKINEILQLVKWTDINSDSSINVSIKHQQRKLLKNLLRIRLNGVIEDWKEKKRIMELKNVLEENREIAKNEIMAFL